MSIAGAPRDRREPRRRIAIEVEPVGGLPRVHERVLHRFLGELVPSERVVRDRVDQVAVLPIHRADCVRVAVAEGFERARVHRAGSVPRRPRPAALPDGTFAVGYRLQLGLPPLSEIELPQCTSGETNAGVPSIGGVSFGERSYRDGVTTDSVSRGFNSRADERAGDARRTRRCRNARRRRVRGRAAGAARDGSPE